MNKTLTKAGCLEIMVDLLKFSSMVNNEQRSFNEPKDEGHVLQN